MVKPLKFIAVLLISLGGGAGYSIAQTALYSPADQYELQARFYIAGDNRTGSYLIRNPGQRHLFGFPIEPMTEFDSRSATYPDFTKTMITYLRDEAAWAVVIDKFPVLAPPIKLTKSSYDLLNDISKNPDDPHTKLKALGLGVAIGAAVVAPELVVPLEAAGVLIDHTEKVGSLARSQVMANRARAQVRLPVGVQQQANATLTETIGMRAGTFEMKGDRFQAEGSWKLDHSDGGARSELHARYDFKKFYMPNGSVISTIGTGNNYTNQERVEDRRGGSRVTTSTHSSYRVTRDGAALSKAVEVYDRTKVWDADSTVGKFSREHQADQSRMKTLDANYEASLNYRNSQKERKELYLPRRANSLEENNKPVQKEINILISGRGINQYDNIKNIEVGKVTLTGKYKPANYTYENHAIYMLPGKNKNDKSYSKTYKQVSSEVYALLVRHLAPNGKLKYGKTFELRTAHDVNSINYLFGGESQKRTQTYTVAVLDGVDHFKREFGVSGRHTITVGIQAGSNDGMAYTHAVNEMAKQKRKPVDFMFLDDPQVPITEVQKAIHYLGEKNVAIFNPTKGLGDPVRGKGEIASWPANAKILSGQYPEFRVYSYEAKDGLIPFISRHVQASISPRKQDKIRLYNARTSRWDTPQQTTLGNFVDNQFSQINKHHQISTNNPSRHSSRQVATSPNPVTIVEHQERKLPYRRKRDEVYDDFIMPFIFGGPPGPGGGGASGGGGPPCPPDCGGGGGGGWPGPGPGGSANTASFSNVTPGVLPTQNHRLASLIQPGGVLLDIKNLTTIENSKFADSLGSRAMEVANGRAKISEIMIGGKKYVVARAFSKTPPAKKDTSKHNQSLAQHHTPQMVGRYVDSPVDLIVKKEGQLVLYIQRFYDSTTTSSDHRTNSWSWQPYELRIGFKPQQNNKNKQAADTIVLFDRAASLELFYRRGNTELDSKRNEALNPGLVLYRGMTRSDQPKLLQQPSGDYLVQFPHGFNLGFNREGKLLWQAHNQSSQIHYQYLNGQLTRLTKGSAKITFKYNAKNRIISARGSNGKMVRYQYNKQGYLSNINSESFGDLQYTYSKAGRLVEIKASPDSKIWHLITRNRYDTRGRMLSHESSYGKWRLEYDDKLARVSVTDWEDITTHYYYDSARRLVGYGQSEDDMILLNYGHQGQLLQVAHAKLTSKSLSRVSPVFQIIELLTPLANQ